MPSAKDIPEFCQRCNQRKPTMSMAVFEDGDPKFRHFCNECSEILLANAPKSLQELMDQLEPKKKPE